MERTGADDVSPMITPPHTRVAIPDGDGFKIHEVVSTDFRSFREMVVDMVSSALEVNHSHPPEITVRELIDNFVHAVPCTASVVVDPSLDRFYVSDTGPGITRLDLALEPGYSTATEVHRSVIRGVGLGFFLAEKEISYIGGSLQVFSQPGGGTYITVSLTCDVGSNTDGLADKLSHRQNNILFLLTEQESVGPSQVASELGVSLSTAHRELVKLERLGLIARSTDGKRFLSDIGKSYLQSILSL